MNINVYTQPNCPQCDFTMRRFDRLGIEYAVTDVSEDPEAHKYVTEDLGYRQTPVVTVEGEGPKGRTVVSWSGLRPDLINKVQKGTVLQ